MQVRSKNYSFKQRLQQAAGGKEIRLNLVVLLVLMLLPLADGGLEDGMRVVPAQEILDKIERGEPVEYDHVIVEGDLDLRKLDLPKRWVERTPDEVSWGLSENVSLVLSPIRINDSIINGTIDFISTIFNATDFSDSTFNGPAYFSYSTFNDSADFLYSSFYEMGNFFKSSFNGPAHFSYSTFNDSADFRYSSFYERGDFFKSSFKNVTHFSGSSFYDEADFWESSFYDEADFSSSSFNRLATFLESSFNGPAVFRYTSFNDVADFWISSFYDEADFSDSSFYDEADFSSSLFNGTANFWSSSFNGTANFWGSSFNISKFASSQFNEQAYFDDSQFRGSTTFNSTRFKEDASFEGADFNGTLYLSRAKYDKLYISWKNIKELGYDDAAYLALLENFKKLGYFEDYDACYYEYRLQHREQNWSGGYHAMHPAEELARKRIDALLDVFYGYGKKPLWPLLWSVGTVLFFGIIWLVSGMNGHRGKNDQGIFERFGEQNAAEMSGRQDRWSGLRAFADALLFSATVFLSGTRLFVEPPAQPEMQRLSANRVKWAMIVERVLGALFSILFFLAIGGTVVR